MATAVVNADSNGKIFYLNITVEEGIYEYEELHKLKLPIGSVSFPNLSNQSEFSSSKPTKNKTFNLVPAAKVEFLNLEALLNDMNIPLNKIAYPPNAMPHFSNEQSTGLAFARNVLFPLQKLLDNSFDIEPQLQLFSEGKFKADYVLLNPKNRNEYYVAVEMKKWMQLTALKTINVTDQGIKDALCEPVAVDIDSLPDILNEDWFKKTDNNRDAWMERVGFIKRKNKNGNESYDHLKEEAKQKGNSKTEYEYL
ncbi:uncharacterized protein LOC111614904 [Centruroides sculpturatus]|uniref:uncharacterized protein LOC111614904 n=1 Tax=Centruroides sculpturatus TaxID=218467 RepID=UPI000C6EF007|nr:uncharacterized protein LOC111614904 [Centruroides sculpturatus]